MRLLMFINLIAIVVIAGALAHMYEGTPLPLKLVFASDKGKGPAQPATPEPMASATPPEGAVTPAPNPKRVTVALEPQHQPRATLRVLTEGAYPPFNYHDGNGDLTGFDVDMARALCDRLKRDCVIETRAWAELLPALKRGEGDVVIASTLIPSHGRPVPAHDADIAYTQAYYTTPGHFAARRDARLSGASADALAGRRIVVEAGTTHEAFLKARYPDAVILDVSSLSLAQSSLVNGRADLLFADRNALLRWMMSGKGAECCRLVGRDYNDPIYFGPGAGIALRVEDEALLASIDKALVELNADGTQAKISTRYFGQNIR